jgi:hypothetical protein
MLRFLAAFLFSHAHTRRIATVGRWPQPITQRRVLSMIQVERQAGEVNLELTAGLFVLYFH